MRCDRCGGKGYIDGWMAFGNGHRPTLEQCPARCNITGYSNEVQKRLNAMAQSEALTLPRPEVPVKIHECKILPFRPRGSG